MLRGGLRLPIIEKLPTADYFCIVSLAAKRPSADLYHWTLQQLLPTLPIPLKQGDDDVPLNLQEALDTGYDLSVNYYPMK